MLLHGQKCHPDAIAARLRQLESQLAALSDKKLVRDLDQHPGTVASFRIAAAGAPVRQVQENLDPLGNDVVTLLPADAGNEPDSTSVVLVRRIIQALGRRQTVR